MAKRSAQTAASSGRREKDTRSKAQQAAGKNKQELVAEQRNNLLLRLLLSVLLVFCTLFLILSMLGIHAVFLDLLRSLVRGIWGYGYWLMPLAFLYMAYMLFFLHGEPIASRMVCTALLPVVFGALFHTVFCRVTFVGGWEGLKALWTTGTEGASGGVIPGLISLGLTSLISKGGAIPVLLVLTAVLIFGALRLSAAKLIHFQAEKRRKKLEELWEDEPEPEPIVYDTRADLRVLATPPVRPRVRQERLRQESFDLPVGGEHDYKNDVEADVETDEEFPFLTPDNKKSKKKKKREAVSESSPFDIPVGSSYSTQVRALAQEAEEEAPERSRTLPWQRTVSLRRRPMMSRSR